MKKFTNALFLFSVILGLGFVSPVNAQSPDLAEVFPADAIFYLEARVDQQTLNDLDALYAQFVESLPANLDLPPTATDIVDDILTENMGFTIADVQQWIGNSMAAGTRLEDGRNVQIIAAEIADSTLATSFLSERLNVGPLETNAAPGYEIYVSSDSTVACAISSFLVCTTGDVVNLHLSSEASLGQHEAYTEAINALPLDRGAYVFKAFANTPAVLQSMFGGDFVDLSSLGIELATLGPTSVGMGLIEGNVLVTDIAQVESFPLAETPFQPIDFEFAQHIPARSQFTLHGANFAATLDSLTSSIVDNTDSEAAAMTSLAVTMFGAEWATGDYVLFGDFSSEEVLTALFEGDDLSGLSIGLAIEVTDLDAANETADRIPLLADMADLEVSTELIQGTNVTAINTGLMGTELLVGIQDNIFFLATRPGAEAIINETPTMLESAQFVNVSNHILDDASMLLYASNSAWLEVITLVVGLEEYFTLSVPSEDLKAGVERIRQEYSPIASLIGATSISTYVSDDNTLLVRFAIDLS
jgi:hypothetical protein